MVYVNNKNNFINSLQRVTKMLKPLLRLLSKRHRSAAPKAVPSSHEDFSADCDAENAANEALEARMQQQSAGLMHGAMTVVVVPQITQWSHAAPDRDISCDSLNFSSCCQSPEQQSPSPKSIQLHDQEWW